MVTKQLSSSYGGGGDGRYFSNKSIMKVAYITMFFLVSILLLSPSLREEISARSVSKLSTQFSSSSSSSLMVGDDYDDTVADNVGAVADDDDIDDDIDDDDDDDNVGAVADDVGADDDDIDDDGSIL